MSFSATGPYRSGPVATGRSYPYRSLMGMINTAEWTVFMDDFMQDVATNVPTGWDAAIIDTGATLTTGSSGSTWRNGVALIASDGASEGVAIYLPKGIKITSGKKFVMEVRVQTTLAAETDVQFGLSDLTATTNPEDLWTTTSANLIAFGTLAGSAATKMLSDKSNSGTSAQTGSRSLSDATWHTLAIYWDGSQLRGYVDGKESLTWSSAVSTTVPVDTAMAAFVGSRTGATAANTTVIDYVRIAIER